MPFPNNPTGAIMTRDELMELVPVIIEKTFMLYQMRYIQSLHTAITSIAR